MQLLSVMATEQRFGDGSGLRSNRAAITQEPSPRGTDAIVTGKALQATEPGADIDPETKKTRRFQRVSSSGRYWARTSDPQLAELVLSQLS